MLPAHVANLAQMFFCDDVNDFELFQNKRMCTFNLALTSSGAFNLHVLGVILFVGNLPIDYSKSRFRGIKKLMLRILRKRQEIIGCCGHVV